MSLSHDGATVETGSQEPPGIELGRVRSSTLREQVLDALRAAIITGTLAPGSLWSAPRLASLLGVSATPVREAMLELCSRGFATAERNRGYRIVQLSTRDLEEVFRIRSLLEIPSAGVAAEVMRPIDIEALARLAQLTEDTAASGDLTAFTIADREFHSTIMRSLDNKRLLALTESLRDQTRLYALPKLMASGDLTPFAREHVAIANAIADRDAAQAVELMDAHFNHTRSVWY